MELKINVDYNEILGLVHQLPEKDKERLATILQTEISSRKPSKFNQKLILEAPIWSEDDYKNFTDERKHFNKSRII
jgi:hypothetical protein